MNEAPKFKTFRDLKELHSPVVEKGNTSISSNTSNSSIPRITSITSLTNKEIKEPSNTPATEISPIKDFQKVPNSVTREVLAQGYFKGKSKQVWDYLWSISRGAIQPTRFVRKSRKEIKSGSGIGSMVTVDAAIEHLEQFGLIKVERAVGSLIGNKYEIFTPEEIRSSNTSISSISSPIQKLDNLVLPETSNTRTTQQIENKEVYELAKTSLKTNTKNDDEAFAAMIENLAKAFEKTSGKVPRKSDSEKLKELSELLVMELEIAAARTKSVTNAPAFLTEHLRRRLMPAKKEAAKSKSNKPSQVGKQQPTDEIETYQAEPLTKEGRESTLRTFIGYMEKGQKEFLMGLQDTYTTEDWEWLMNKLKQE